MPRLVTRPSAGGGAAPATDSFSQKRADLLAGHGVDRRKESPGAPDDGEHRSSDAPINSRADRKVRAARSCVREVARGGRDREGTSSVLRDPPQLTCRASLVSVTA